MKGPKRSFTQSIATQGLRIRLVPIFLFYLRPLNRTLKSLPAANKPVQDCKEYNDPYDRTAVVHIRRRNGDEGWEGQKDSDKDSIDDGKDIDR